jgi:hypothetical protein
MTSPFSGGCACGAIRYSIVGEPPVMRDCQCRHCQQRSGTGHSSYLAFQDARVELSGEARKWEVTGDEGTVKSHAFCPVCGAPVYLTVPAMPQFFAVHAGSLDEPARYRPQAVLFAARGQPWDHVDPGLQRFDTMPPADARQTS